MSATPAPPRIVQPPVSPTPEQAVRWTNQLEFLSKKMPCFWRHRFAHVFHYPVDVVELEVPDYYNVITNPMDLSTIKQRLANLYYWSASEAIDDFQLMFANCAKFNRPTDTIYEMGIILKTFFESKLKEMPEDECEITPPKKCRARNVKKKAEETKPVVAQIEPMRTRSTTAPVQNPASVAKYLPVATQKTPTIVAKVYPNVAGSASTNNSMSLPKNNLNHSTTITTTMNSVSKNSLRSFFEIGLNDSEEQFRSLLRGAMAQNWMLGWPCPPCPGNKHASASSAPSALCHQGQKTEDDSQKSSKWLDVRTYSPELQHCYALLKRLVYIANKRKSYPMLKNVTIAPEWKPFNLFCIKLNIEAGKYAGYLDFCQSMLLMFEHFQAFAMRLQRTNLIETSTILLNEFEMGKERIINALQLTGYRVDPTRSSQEHMRAFPENAAKVNEQQIKKTLNANATATLKHKSTEIIAAPAPSKRGRPSNEAKRQMQLLQSFNDATNSAKRLKNELITNQQITDWSSNEKARHAALVQKLSQQEVQTAAPVLSEVKANTVAKFDSMNAHVKSFAMPPVPNLSGTSSSDSSDESDSAESTSSDISSSSDSSDSNSSTQSSNDGDRVDF